jgi:hypothetical protein
MEVTTDEQGNPNVTPIEPLGLSTRATLAATSPTVPSTQELHGSIAGLDDDNSKLFALVVLTTMHT